MDVKRAARAKLWLAIDITEYNFRRNMFFMVLCWTVLLQCYSHHSLMHPPKGLPLLLEPPRRWAVKHRSVVRLPADVVSCPNISVEAKANIGARVRSQWVTIPARRIDELVMYWSSP